MLVFERHCAGSSLTRQPFTRFGPSRISVPPRQMRELQIPEDTATARDLVRRHCKPVPGVYGMITQSGELIYIGYSANLPSRLLTYFSDGDRRSKETRIAARARKLVWEEVGHPLAAELRELELIRRFHPRMNRQGRTIRQKTGYLAIASHDSAKVTVVDEQPQGGGRCWGPLQITRRVIDAVAELNLAYGLADTPFSFYQDVDANVFSRTLRKIEASESGHHLRACLAAEFLDGDSQELIECLQAEMRGCQSKMNFHRAARLRDQWQLLTYLQTTVSRQCHPQKYEFIYRIVIGRKDYWLAISGSEIRWAGRAPLEKKSARIVLDQLDLKKRQAFNVEVDRGQQNIVNRWFRQHPEELVATCTLSEARQRCELMLSYKAK